MYSKTSNYFLYFAILESIQLVLTLLNIFISKCAKIIFNLNITVKFKIIQIESKNYLK